jgi:hypothetical protein
MTQLENSSRDGNYVPTLTAVLNTDGITVKKITVNSANHGIMVNNGVGGTDFGPTNAIHDDNDIHTMVAVSSVDFTTPVVLYADSGGKLLIQST